MQRWGRCKQICYMEFSETLTEVTASSVYQDCLHCNPFIIQGKKTSFNFQCSLADLSIGLRKATKMPRCSAELGRGDGRASKPWGGRTFRQSQDKLRRESSVQVNGGGYFRDIRIHSGWEQGYSK